MRTSRLCSLGCLSAASRLPLGCVLSATLGCLSAGARLPLGCLSATLGCLSVASRLLSAASRLSQPQKYHVHPHETHAPTALAPFVGLFTVYDKNTYDKKLVIIQPNAARKQSKLVIHTKLTSPKSTIDLKFHESRGSRIYDPHMPNADASFIETHLKQADQHFIHPTYAQTESASLLDLIKTDCAWLQSRTLVDYSFLLLPDQAQTDELKKNLANKIFGYLARCEGSFCTTTHFFF